MGKTSNLWSLFRSMSCCISSLVNSKFRACIKYHNNVWNKETNYQNNARMKRLWPNVFLRIQVFYLLNFTYSINVKFEVEFQHLAPTYPKFFCFPWQKSIYFRQWHNCELNLSFIVWPYQFKRVWHLIWKNTIRTFVNHIAWIKSSCICIFMFTLMSQLSTVFFIQKSWGISGTNYFITVRMALFWST